MIISSRLIKEEANRLGFEKGIAEARARAMQVSETTFKIDEELVDNLEVFEDIVNAEFLQSCLSRFVNMRSDFINEFNKYKNE